MLIVHVISYVPIQRSHKKNGNFWPYFYKELPKNSLDVVFMGNSHAKTTFIPKIVDDILGIQSIHVNTSGASIFQTIFEYQEVLRYQNPQIVIIETYPIFAGLDKDEQKPWNFSFFYSIPNYIRKIIYAHKYFDDGDLLKFYLPFTTSHSDWKSPDLFILRTASELEKITQVKDFFTPVKLPHKGYENYLKSLEPGDVEISPPLKNKPCAVKNYSERLSVTEQILEINEKHQEDLMFIETLQFVNKYENCRGQAQQVIGQYDVPYEILMDHHEPSLLWFGDHQHMTQFGAIIASVETAELLARELNVKMNPEALNYYRSYFFNEYTIVQEGDKASIQLDPMDEEAQKELIYKWEVFLNDETILRHKAKGKNELTFSLPEPVGEYFIHVVIVNPDGHYPLRGGFGFELE